MDAKTLPTLFTPDTLLRLFPRDRANEFFEALFGDADEGAYDIELGYRGLQDNELVMELRLHERPGRCLACNLTQGLPQVFSRHPIINLNRLVEDIGELLQGRARCTGWSLGSTEQQSRSLHVVPLKIRLETV
ncbi:MAG TPA: pancreas/duodenum homeobox protein 1 [Desulfoprunum sp.]|nr:pancreas/duodenum homeobox protein 1 [Desulfoprunum sp.]